MKTKTFYSNLVEFSKEDNNYFFEEYFNSTGAITENEFSALIAYFERRTDNKLAAEAMTYAVIGSSITQGVGVMEVLEQFKKLDQTEVDAYLAFFLNFSRYPTSAIGLSNVINTNKYVARSILP